ncbi:MAG TPA: serine/threonine-protein kinase [Kofleriaceae bacterium]|nr:serine/threonine-protein kinase [Kofleriaceae bacterium]
MPSADGDGPLLGGRWRLGPKLGAGTQAETYLATEVARRAEVVVKRVKLGAGWKSFELHERETKVLGQLRHPGVPRLLGALEEPKGTFNLVMQRMPGDNLREVARRQRLSEAELRDVLVRTLEILDYLGTRSPPVVHRDLKPTNLVRDRDGTISLVDFGGVADSGGGGSTLVGTYGYMAPEQLHGQATPATDLYALGATIVALASGKEPEEIPRKGLKMDLARALPSMSPGLRGVLEAMVEPDPDVRPQRARDVAAMLAKAKPGAEPVREAREAREARDRERERREERALATVEVGPPAPRRRARPMFTGVPEPLGALLRLAMLSFAVSGWLGMMIAVITVRVIGGVVGLVAGRRRRPAIRAATDDVAGVLADGRDGFSDLARRSVARRDRKALPGR